MKTNDISVHQLIAYQTILCVHKTLKNRKPTYVYNKIKPHENVGGLRNGSKINVQAELTVSRGGFIYRGSKLYNMIPNHIKDIEGYGEFKSNIKKWIQDKILVKPR